MLDQMSGGRLDVGFGRGASPIELDLFGTNPAEARDIYDEALAIVVQGLRERTVSFKGKHFNFDNVPMEMTPLQKPHPPIWYGVHANDSAARSARQATECHQPRRCARRRAASAKSYRAAWKEAGRGGPMPKFGLGRMLVVADTDAEALRLAERAYPVWQASFVHLFKVYDRMPHASAPGGIFRDRGGRPRALRLAGDGDRDHPQADGGGGRRLFRRPVRLRRSDARGNAAFDRAVRPRGHAGAARLNM